MIMLKGIKKIACLLAFLPSIFFVSPTSAVTQLSSNGSLNFSVTVPESISISLPSTAPTIAFTDITKTGSFSYSSYGVTVGTNVARRYTLSMYSFNTSTTTSDLVSGTHALPTLSAAQTVSDLSTGAGWTSLNRWGYALGTTSDSSWTFSGVSGDSSNATIIHNLDDSVAQVTNGITTNIILGTKVDLNQAFGDYTTNLNFIVVAEPPQFDGITTMQAMTPTICEAASVNASVQLQDTRDGKLYWITKLADGNCWMTQNLDLDITTDGFTDADTDLNSVTAWNASSTYAPAQTQTSMTRDNNDTGTTSWDLGDYVYDGTSDSSCGTSGYNTASYAGCTGFSSAADLPANSLARHYHIGNFYQWNTATAGSGGTTTSGQAADSICPKGWRLPTSTSSGEFQTLVNVYAAGSATQNLINPPLYFVRSGYHSAFGVYHAGDFGNYWSSTPYSDASKSYIFEFYGSIRVVPSLTSRRYLGNSVRCVARGPIQNISEVTTMQQFGSLSSSEKTAVMNSMTTGAQYQLRDTRDNKLYWVSKLADGNVWMTQNLDLDLSTSTALTSVDSDVTSNWTPTLSTYTSTGTWNYFYDQSESYDPDNNYIPSGTGSATSAASLASNSTDLHYHQGNYYNWYAATAGSNASTMSDYDEAPQSICPKGWRLPYGTQANKSWYYLVNQASITASNTTTSPFYIPRAGYYGGSVNDVGPSGYYWSSTVVGGGGAYYLFLASSCVYPQSNGIANFGFSVRCLAR